MSTDLSADDSHWPIEDSGFLRLIVASDEEQPYHGGRIRLLLLELYRAGMILTWLLDGLPDRVFEEGARHPDVVAAVARQAEQDHARGASGESRYHNRTFAEEFEVSIHLHPHVTRVTDDLGNLYAHPRSQSSGYRVMRGMVHVRPALHPDARRLTIEIGAATFELEIGAT
jgi:hypothetical protein